MCVYVFAYTYICILFLYLFVYYCIHGFCLGMHVCMYVCTYIYIHIYVIFLTLGAFRAPPPKQDILRVTYLFREEVLTRENFEEIPKSITQRAQYSLIKEYTLNNKGIHIMI